MKNFKFPIIRHFSQQLVPLMPYIQPMTAPAGAVFYMDYVYGDYIIKQIKVSINIKETLFNLILEYNDGGHLRDVVSKNFPIHLELLNKLLLLK